MKRKIASSVAELSFVGVILALVAITARAAFLIIVSKGWNADAAAWVQAAGSIIAIGGAVWLSRDEARRARAERRQKSEEEAWGVRFVMAQAQYDAQIIAAELTKSERPLSRTDVESCYSEQRMRPSRSKRCSRVRTTSIRWSSSTRAMPRYWSEP